MTTQASPIPTRLEDLASRAGFLFLLKDLKIGNKLMVGFGILVLLTLISAGVSYLGSDQATQKIESTNVVRVPTALLASRAQANLLRMMADARGYLALGDRSFRDNYDQSTRAFESDLAALDGLSPDLDPENQRRLVELRTAYGEWSQLPDTLFELRDDQFEREPAYRLMMTKGTQFAGRVVFDFGPLVETQTQREPTPENMARMQDMARFQSTFVSMFSSLRSYVTTRNRIFRGEYEVNLADNQNAWDRLYSRRDTLTANQQKLIESVAQNRTEFLRQPAQIFADLEGPRWREDLYLFSERALPVANKMQQLLNELVSAQQQQLTRDLAAGQQDLVRANQLILTSGVVALLIGIVMAVVAAANIAGPISRLTQVAERIRGGDLEVLAQVESKDETGTLAETFNNMTRQLRLTLTQVRKEKKRADDLLEVVIPIGADLASEKNYNRLLEKILMEAKSFCRADAGTLYLKTEDNHLKYVIIRDDTQKIALGGTTGASIPFAPIAMYRKTGEPNDRVIASYVALTGASVNVDNAQSAHGFDFSGPTESHVYTDSLATSLLAIPLKNSQGQVLGVLQLMNAQDPDSKQIIPFDPNLQRMMESFSMLAIAALEAYMREQSLQQQIQRLKIEIDEVKRQKQVSEIVDTDFFQDIQSRARAIRERKRQAGESGASQASS